VLAFAAERAVKRVLRVAAANFAHSSLRLREGSTSTRQSMKSALKFRSTTRVLHPNLPPK
jgi:hypothetical protein